MRSVVCPAFLYVVSDVAGGNFVKYILITENFGFLELFFLYELMKLFNFEFLQERY